MAATDEAIRRIRRESKSPQSKALLRHLYNLYHGRARPMPTWQAKNLMRLPEENLDLQPSFYRARRLANRLWCWPFPTREPLEAIRWATWQAGQGGQGLLISPFRGNGMIERLLDLPGDLIFESDLHAVRPGQNGQNGKTSHTVHKMDAEKAVRTAAEGHRGRRSVLLISWPPLGIDAAHRALQAFPGRLIAYWGEDEDGNCAEDGFFQLLKAEWRPVRRPPCASWPTIHDRLTIYERIRGGQVNEG